ncbi:hypothetical protein MAPG_01881 [Magnaporthiopsis poae ATCC 64411]|uniref:Uncharacterized protein n=1 Tax=Magnaporthiopsis poae (strain ATCC 64411 / 73-15) TaxID=644358 RepID=A0A0C4DPV2_MAGP6|nr:hypothetical protein MAPG_01881 [Magnaporthiopsis poae ATCC 64411]
MSHARTALMRKAPERDRDDILFQRAGTPGRPARSVSGVSEDDGFAAPALAAGRRGVELEWRPPSTPSHETAPLIGRTVTARRARDQEWHVAVEEPPCPR